MLEANSCSEELIEVGLQFAMGRGRAFGENHCFTDIQLQIGSRQFCQSRFKIVHEIVSTTGRIDRDAMSTEQFQLSIKSALVQFQLSNQCVTSLRSVGQQCQQLADSDSSFARYG